MKSVNKPLISVCVPAYNHEKYVIDAINSVINQTYQNLELIVIDDGSTDSTWEKLHSLKGKCDKRFKRTVFETQKNHGLLFTENRLFHELATGEYIVLLASDDKLLPTAIEKLFSFLVKNPDVGEVVGKNLIMDSDGIQCYWDKDRNNVYDKHSAIYLSFTDFINKTTHITKNKYGKYSSLFKVNHIANGYMIRKSIIDRIPKFTISAPLEDWFLHLQISKITKISAIDDETFIYRWHASNTIKQKEHCDNMFKKTKDYERKLLLERPKKDYLLNYKIFRIKYKIGFYINKYIFTKTKNDKKRTLKLFGINILSFCKK